MTSDRLLRALDKIDDAFIEEAAPGAKRKIHRTLLKGLSIAASFLLAAALGAGIWQSGLFKGSPEHFPGRQHWPIKYVSEASSSGSEAVLLPRWDEQTISQQYQEVLFNSYLYSTRQTEISSSSVDTILGTSTASGVDEYTNTAHETAVTVYSIKEFSKECAVAVRFDEQTEYYVYINSSYQPETLGDLISDLNLKETLSFGSVYYSNQTDGTPAATIEFTDLEDCMVWEMLLSDEGLKTAADSGAIRLDSKMSVSVNIPLLGYQNIGLWVTEDGYLVTNILDTAKIFNPGAKKTEQFIHYVIEHCKGYEIKYENSGVSVPE